MGRYATAIPNDVTGSDIQGAVVPQKAFVTNTTDNGVSSSVITFTDNTTDIEISAVGSTVFGRWVPRTETAGVAPFGSVISIAGTSNYDFVVPAGMVRRAVIPVERQGPSSIVGANIANGLYNRIAYKTAAPGSILATEY